MTIKHTPATPLKIAGEVQMKKIQHDMTVLRRTNERLLSDRAKLVAELRWYLTGKGQPDFDGERGRALLRELGEA